MTRVFVYGSLMSGMQNNRLLEDSALVGRGTTAAGYTMCSLGGYPAVAQGGTTSVHGEVWEVDDTTLACLDMLEGHPRYYERQYVSVLLQGGGFTLAQAYLLPLKAIVRKPIVSDGDWRAYYRYHLAAGSASVRA